MELVSQLQQQYDKLWRLRDERMDGLPLLGSPIAPVIVCFTYLYIVKVAGPKFMKHREPFELRTFLVFYNAFQVGLSAFITYLVSGVPYIYLSKANPMHFMYCTY